MAEFGEIGKRLSGCNTEEELEEKFKNLKRTPASNDMRHVYGTVDFSEWSFAEPVDFNENEKKIISEIIHQELTSDDFFAESIRANLPVAYNNLGDPESQHPLERDVEDPLLMRIHIPLNTDDEGVVFQVSLVDLIDYEWLNYLSSIGPRMRSNALQFADALEAQAKRIREEMEKIDVTEEDD